jgi:hypothetical protein
MALNGDVKRYTPQILTTDSEIISNTNFLAQVPGVGRFRAEP